MTPAFWLGIVTGRPARTYESAAVPVCTRALGYTCSEEGKKERTRRDIGSGIKLSRLCARKRGAVAVATTTTTTSGPGE